MGVNTIAKQDIAVFQGFCNNHLVLGQSISHSVKSIISFLEDIVSTVPNYIIAIV